MYGIIVIKKKKNGRTYTRLLIWVTWGGKGQGGEGMNLRESKGVNKYDNKMKQKTCVQPHLLIHICVTI